MSEKREPPKTTFRMGEQYQDLLSRMAELTGMSQAQVMRISLDKLALEMGIKPVSKYVPNLEASFPMMTN